MYTLLAVMHSLAGILGPAQLPKEHYICNISLQGRPYKFYDIDYSGPRLHVSSISNSEAVVGSIDLPDKSLSTFAFMLNNGGAVRLPAESDLASADVISQNGHFIAGNLGVVGVGAALWRRQEGHVSPPETLSTGYGISNWAMGVNNRGDIVGWQRYRSFYRHAALINLTDKHIVDLGTLGGPNSYAASINNSGTIVGGSECTGIRAPVHAFKYSNKKLTDLGSLQVADDSEAASIDGAGNVVGHSADRAVEWPNGAGICALPDYGHGSQAVCIYGKYIVGSCKSSTGADDAVVWISGKVFDLSSPLAKVVPRLHLTVASGVNSNGDIIGYMLQNGRREAFLLKRQ